MDREANRALVRRIAISEPQVQGLSAERTLNIEGVPTKGWPCPEARGCFFVALYVLRAALEQGCSTICIKRSWSHKHLFDVVKLLKYTARQRNGFLSRPKFRAKNGGVRMPPSYLATWKHKSIGNWFDVQKPIFPVTVSLNSLSGVNRAKGV